jgi:hypothetical protein
VNKYFRLQLTQLNVCFCKCTVTAVTICGRLVTLKGQILPEPEILGDLNFTIFTKFSDMLSQNGIN